MNLSVIVRVINASGGTGAAEDTNTRPSDAGQSQQKKTEVSFSETENITFISTEEKVQHSLEKEKH